MSRLTLQYWKDGDWYVGRIKEVPGVISQGKTFASLQKNIKDAYRVMLSDRPKIRRPTKTKSILLPA